MIVNQCFLASLLLLQLIICQRQRKHILIGIHIHHSLEFIIIASMTFIITIIIDKSRENYIHMIKYYRMTTFVVREKETYPD